MEDKWNGWPLHLQRPILFFLFTVLNSSWLSSWLTWVFPLSMDIILGKVRDLFQYFSWQNCKRWSLREFVHHFPGELSCISGRLLREPTYLRPKWELHEALLEEKGSINRSGKGIHIPGGDSGGQQPWRPDEQVVINSCSWNTSKVERQALGAADSWFWGWLMEL